MSWTRQVTKPLASSPPHQPPATEPVPTSNLMLTYHNQQDPEHVLIKRWVPREEQRELWSLTKVVRGGREKARTALGIEPHSHHHRHHGTNDNLVLLRKTKRGRSRSPKRETPDGLVSLAGGGLAALELGPSGQSPHPVSQQPSRATGVPKVTLPEVDKEIVDLLLRRWTPGAAEVSDGSKGWGSEDEEGMEAEQSYEERQLDDEEAKGGIKRQ